MDIREMRKRTGMTQHDFAQRLGIPKRTVQNWETSERECPQYLKQLIYYYLKNEGIMRTDNAIELIGKVKLADRVAALAMNSEKTPNGTEYTWEPVYKLANGDNGLIQWDGPRQVFKPLDDFEKNQEGIRTRPRHYCRSITREEQKNIPNYSNDKDELKEIK